ncbi:Acyl-CoA dehydrogenase family protein [Sulfidibacter corallicola]|uniref:Cyclohex-1-ene-1-carbonyl-CoA dehydrogenase n=1 Tax=Sulfidibacter corallicola TaxID=2818388 RepID=A0A8A4TTH8_SULCO|nr:acyl-CoA dehydrogenase family protein [Sulfidibacter corallicola]QTD52398.1 acyl-CoA dehydrogenase family protein [Sulfidibacter corallicola]
MSVQALTVLSEEEQLLYDSVYEYALEKIKPKVHEMDESEKMESEFIADFFENDYMAIEIPEQYEGLESGFFSAILVIEALSRVDPSCGVLVDVHNTLVNNAVNNWGSDSLKAKYFPQLATKRLGAYCLSEPASGSDAFALKTTAKDMGDHFVLNGSKLWITNGLEASIFIVFANVNPEAGYRGITAFVVEDSFEGFRRGKKESKLGIRASSTMELSFEDMKVPKENVLGEVGKGYKVAIETLNEGRIGIGAQMIGLARGALDAAVAYAKERVQFGQPIATFQAVQHEIARMEAELEAARLLVYNAARLKDMGQSFLREAAIAKLKASEAAELITSRSLELFGGYGYSKEYPAEKFYRDAKIGKIYEGTSFMQLNTIAKLALG